MRTARKTAVAALFCAAASTVANAGEHDCIDAIVSARAVRQIPSIIPDCGDDCIVMRWPWFIDLEVNRVIEGQVGKRHLSVLTVQHTYLVKGAMTWWLRRNTEGGFNAGLVSDERLPRCAMNDDPAKPFLRPSKGDTLESLRRAAERDRK